MRNQSRVCMKVRISAEESHGIRDNKGSKKDTSLTSLSVVHHTHCSWINLNTILIIGLFHSKTSLLPTSSQHSSDSKILHNLVPPPIP